MKRRRWAVLPGAHVRSEAHRTARCKASLRKSLETSSKAYPPQTLRGHAAPSLRGLYMRSSELLTISFITWKGASCISRSGMERIIETEWRTPDTSEERLLTEQNLHGPYLLSDSLITSIHPSSTPPLQPCITAWYLNPQKGAQQDMGSS